jgi:hypothetical protein
MKSILITVVAIFVGVMVACGGGGLQFAGAQDVVNSFDEFDFKDCEVMFYQMVGATSGLSCSVSQSEHGRVEVYAYDGDAETLCKKLEFCKEANQWGGIQVFSENVMLMVYDDMDLANSLIDDLQQ